LLVLVCFILNCLTAVAGPYHAPPIKGTPNPSLFCFDNQYFDNGASLFYRDGISSQKDLSNSNENVGDRVMDSLPRTVKNMVIIPFEYKQSALYHPFTFKAIDSVIAILLENDSVTLSIEGYAHVDEGIDSICYYLSLNRALVIRDYILGRGVDSSRILSLKGFGNVRSAKRKANNHSVEFNCRTEILMNYPIPPPPLVIADNDEDGITNTEDKCPDEYGERVNNGCPNRDAIIVPFEIQQSSLFSMTYRVLDSVVSILLANPSINISIEGYACKKEGVETLCERLAKERADITRRYLLTRHIAASRILSVASFGNLRPLNACRNPREIARNLRAEIYFIR
jgi:outer membrane protein OmpA-like peptidoglycan-associated protein